jgi:hypothetical protein
MAGYPVGPQDQAFDQALVAQLRGAEVFGCKVVQQAFHERFLPPSF